MQTERKHAGACAYLIRLTINPGDSVDLGRITRAICGLGGVATQQGYAFPDALQRELALDFLSDSFGIRYVEAVDAELAEMQDEV